MPQRSAEPCRHRCAAPSPRRTDPGARRQTVCSIARDLAGARDSLKCERVDGRKRVQLVRRDVDVRRALSTSVRSLDQTRSAWTRPSWPQSALATMFSRPVGTTGPPRFRARLDLLLRRRLPGRRCRGHRWRGLPTETKLLRQSGALLGISGGREGMLEAGARHSLRSRRCGPARNQIERLDGLFGEVDYSTWWKHARAPARTSRIFPISSV